MTQTYGNIAVEIKRDNVFGGVEQHIYRWEGPDLIRLEESFCYDNLRTLMGENPQRTDCIHPSKWKPGMLVKIGPYTIRLLNQPSSVCDPLYASWNGIREDVYDPFGYWLYAATRNLDRIYRRLIVCAAIFRWADVDLREGRWITPSWRDLHIVKHLTGQKITSR